MLDRTALLHRAGEVRRQIFASLPLHIRIAVVLGEIASETGFLDDIGRAIGAEFLLAGVEGMPDPGPNWNPNKPNWAHLPTHYMGTFVRNTWAFLDSHFHDPALALDAFNRYLYRLGRDLKLKPVPRSTAESFVRGGIFNQARTLARSKRQQQKGHESIEDVGPEAKGIRRDLVDPRPLPGEEEEEEEGEQDPEMMWTKWMKYLKEHGEELKPSQWASLAGFFSKHHPTVMHGWMRALTTIHPDMPLYFQLRLKGHNSADIIGRGEKVDPNTGAVIKPGKPTMLKHYEPKPSDPIAWDKTFNRKILPVSLAFFSKMHEEITDAPRVV